MRRADFVWLPDQKIDHDAYFRLVSHEPLRRDDGVNRWVLFRKKFELTRAPEEALLKITCDGRYLLFVNGERAARGPARANPHFMRVDKIDAANFLRAGENVLAVLVHTPGVDLAWYETAKGAWQPVFGDGGLYVDAEIRCNGESLSLLTDGSWRCIEPDAWRRDAPRAGWGQDFIEEFYAEKLSPDWTDASFDDSNWPHVQKMRSQGGPGDVATGRGGHVPFPTLMAREIPPLAESIAAPERVVWTRGVIPQPDLPLDRRLYDEDLCAAPAGMVENADALLRDDETAAVIKTSDGTDAAVMIAFSPYITGYPFIEIEASGGEVIEVAAAEALPGEFHEGRGEEGGLKRPDHLTGAHLFRYHARPGLQRFEKFEWTAVRALQVNVRNAPAGVKIRHVGVRKTHYPAEFAGEFECNDELLNSLWRVGRHTALMCMHDAYEDCPGREKRQWVGDGVLHFDIAAAAFGPSAYPLGRQFLRHSAESQRPDGLIQMYAPGDHRENGVVIPDFTLHWIRGLERYWETTGDLELIEELFPSVERALQWFARHTGEDGLIVDLPFWHFIEWAHVGRGGISAPVNALYAAALKAAAKLARVIDSRRAAARYDERARAVCDALNQNHWNAKRNAYVDEVDPATRTRKARVSQQTNALMIAFDIAPRDRWEAIIAAISDEETLKFTAAPPIFVHAPEFDETRDVVRANTFFCQFLYEAFAKAGRMDLALEHMRGYYKPMLDAGATTLWESFEPSASLCHVFSAAPVYQLSRWTLGVEPTSPGFEGVRICPRFDGLEHAAGVYPTPQGDIAIAWKRTAAGVHVEVSAPTSIEIDLVPPKGHEIAEESQAIEDEKRTVTMSLR